MDYYNENDPNAAAWLMALMEDGLIPEGHVDVRSIRDVSAADLVGYTQCHFFAGIGGWPLALQIAGWPRERRIWTGSCPCQPFSAAGKLKGQEDERHLWPAFADLIRAGKPSVVAGEQVASKLGRVWLAGVFADLEGMGYRRAGANLCSAGVSSPNIRQRLYWVADCQSTGAGQGERRIREVDSGHSETGRMADAAIQRERSGESEGDSRGGVVVAGAESGSDCNDNGETDRMGNAEHHGSSASEIGRCIGKAECHGSQGKDCSRRFAGAGRPGSTGDLCSQHSFSRMGDSNEQGLEGRGERGERAGELSARQTSPWHEYDIVQCRDGRQRRIPQGSVESGIQCMVDGIQPGMDTLWHQGYPLAWQKIESRPAILKGIGNAINPYIAAEFIRAYMQAELLTQQNNQLP